MALDSTEYKTMVIESESSAVGRVFEKILSVAKENNFSRDDLFAIHLALEEAIVNAIKHGNENDPTKKITIQYHITPDIFDIRIRDDGPGFKPEDVPDPRLEENLYKPCGRGLLLIQSYMDSVEYNDQGNEVHMVKTPSVRNSKN